MDDRQTPDPAGAIRHGKCGQWWTGLARLHCGSCCRTFSSESAADRHRTGVFGVDRRCVDPASVGLVAKARPFGVLWLCPAPSAGGAFPRRVAL
ncbi:hypothetical protein OG689_10555 [Kitasatospora sp. NBC_00240]|uniref:FDXHR family putative zinc-binding protein n=1 Tax=Kitasatospora sp. NBC_00240 TaxID=2903567 RepID=UPI00224D3DD8|nr:hypothetical protein [Kitasatospora sp. NBC_00240]MCX5209723.1 hypothetical protein [Kitasatospora sp. NBC_00240]